jgi:hypothetical protein
MNLFWILVFTCTSVIAGTSLCFYLLAKTEQVKSTVWILEHVVCPITRIVVLLFIVSLIYPAVSPETSTHDFWRVLWQQEHFNQAINILFFGSLILAFIPVVSHPVFALPLQSCLSIALVFNWQYGTTLVEDPEFIPGTGFALKIILYLLAVYFVTRSISVPISRWIDRKLTISGSIRLVSDSIYLTLQIPVMLMYCSYLRDQI